MRAPRDTTSTGRHHVRPCLLLAALLLAAAPVHAQQRIRCQVTSITDGDTFRCGERRIRLLGIDTPERSQHPVGDSATAALRRLVPVGSTVTLELDVQPEDRYRRTLAWVWNRRGELVNERLAADGYAVQLTYAPNVRYVERITAAVRLARARGRGLWRIAGFSCEPREHRRHRC